MELVVTITTLIIVVILQIIILANQGKNAKLIREFIANKAKTHPERDRFNERRDNTFRQNRTNQQSSGFKSAPSTQSSPVAANIDNVEKSLRDINLKLKNAEHDQEVARRKIHDNIGSNQQKPRSSRDNRGGNNNSQRRDRNNRNNWRTRNDGDEKPFDNNPESINHPIDTSAPEIRKVVEIHPTPLPSSVTTSVPPSITTSVPSSVTTLPDLQPMDFDADLQHGRKFAVKRRALQEDASAIGQSEVTESDQPTDTTYQQPTPPSQEQPEQSLSNDSEISFGRR
jgi:hypothetical protein